MYFKDIKKGQPIYLFDRNSMEVTQGNVVNVSQPHADSNFNLGQFNANNISMVVDVTVEQEGSTKTYTFKDSTEIGYTGTLAISCDLQQVLNEVRSLKSISDGFLSEVESKTEFHKSCSEKCTSILAKYDPSIKEKAETDARFAKLEEAMASLAGNVNSLAQNVNGFIAEFKK